MAQAMATRRKADWLMPSNLLVLAINPFGLNSMSRVFGVTPKESDVSETFAFAMTNNGCKKMVIKSIVDYASTIS